MQRGNVVCIEVIKCAQREWDVAQVVEQMHLQFGLFSVPTGDPQLVHQSAVLSAGKSI